jgi:hypothetical protein
MRSFFHTERTEYTEFFLDLIVKLRDLRALCVKKDSYTEGS